MTQALASDPRIAVAGPLATAAPEPQRPIVGDLSAESLRDVNYLGGFLLVFARDACRGVGPLSAGTTLEKALWDYFTRLRAAERRMVAVPTVHAELASLTSDQGASFDALWQKERELDRILAESQSAPDTATAIRHLESLVATFPGGGTIASSHGARSSRDGQFRRSDRRIARRPRTDHPPTPSFTTNWAMRSPRMATFSPPK